MKAALLCSIVALLYCVTVNGQASYPYNIDCDSFSPHSTGNTCTDYGSSEQWDQILERPLPDWYADMKLGIFIHWGVFSVPSFGSEWFWHNYACGNTGVKKFADANFPQVKEDYPRYADMWKAELFDPQLWVDTFLSAGAQYVLPVAKHHDGFCLWNTSTSPMWNAVDVGPKRDVLTELYNASVASGLPFGIYYSQGEWFDEDFVADSKTGFNSTAFIQKKLLKQRNELVERFSEAILWHTDGGWMAPDKYWDNLDWLNYVYEKSPLSEHVVSCNSMGVGCCHHTGSGAQKDKCWEYGDAPSGGDRTTAGQVTGHFYTNQMTLQRGSWSWDRSEQKLSDFFSAKELLWTLISTTAWNGTLVMNIGPTADGRFGHWIDAGKHLSFGFVRIPPIFIDRLTSVGDWLKVNGQAIYGTRPWAGSLPSGCEGAATADFAGSANATYYTAGGQNGCQQGRTGCDSSHVGAVYAITMKYPERNRAGSRLLTLKIPLSGPATTAQLLLSTGNIALKWQPLAATGGMVIQLPPFPQSSSNAWVVKLTGLHNK